MKNCWWVIGALVGISIGDAIWKNSKTYKRHVEEMKKSEEETKQILEQMVKEAFPKPNFKDKG